MPDGYLTLEYSKIVPVLVEAIKEQQGIIEKLQNQTDQQAAEMCLIKSELGIIKQRLGEGRMTVAKE